MLLAGAGCSPFGEEPPVLASEEVDFADGAQFVLAQNWFGDETRDVTVEDWVAGERATLAWSMTRREETAASQAAREAAASAPVGSGAVMPDAVYEDVTTTGSVRTDALGNAERVLLPSYWPEGDYDVRGEENSVLWLSRAQYDELVSTRSSHIALGLFDSELQDLLALGDTAKAALAALQGELASEEKTNADVTQLTADADWGDYTVQVNGEERTVSVVRAKNMFASYVILANPENPLILQVSMKPWSLGIGMFSVLRSIDSLAGYHVTSITL